MKAKRRQASYQISIAADGSIGRHRSGGGIVKGHKTETTIIDSDNCGHYLK
ncbi:MAG TPA: hypothetical protein PK918_01910 [Methanotrichaceae archaeon]|nr:hypothetical protein [Methanotrichaceae archaeon]HQI90569.1 hypothetical protein [Methanotrichaceae archaeon]